MTLRAGAATVDITPAGPVVMDGYGGRREPSRGVHDPLFARVLALDHDGSRATIVSCDLLGVHEAITREVRLLAEKRVGIPGEALVACATHDHAGPAGLRGGMFSRLDEALAGTLVQRIIGALEEAVESLQPAELKVGQAAVDTVSQNRRDPEGPIDPALRVLLLDGEDGPIASVMSFACHATVLDGENLVLPAEFPGVACLLVSEQTGAPALYLQGACGNVNPVWVRQDFASVERVGQIVGGAALRVVAELQALGAGQRAHNIRWDEFTEKRVQGRVVEPRLKAARSQTELPLRAVDADGDYSSRVVGLEAKAAALVEGSDQRRAVMAQLTRYRNERWAAMWARRQPEVTAQRTEVQALLLGDGLALLALPGEFFVETAEMIRSNCGVEDLLVACYANDYIGYVIPPVAYEEGGYEAGITLCAPETEGIIVDASLELLRQVTNDN